MTPTYDLEDADRRLGYELRENLDAEHDAQDRRADMAEVVPLHIGEADYPDRLSPRARRDLDSYVLELATRAANIHSALALGDEVSVTQHERVEKAVVDAVDAALLDVRWTALETA